MAIQDQIPRSRITLTYRTTISGEPETVELPLRLLLVGDFTQVEERQDDLDTRRIRGINKEGLGSVMEDMKLGVEFQVPGLFSAEETATLSFKSMRDFDPDRVSEQVGSINALRQMRTLLMELRSSIANQRDFRKGLNRLITGPDLEKFIKDLNENQFNVFDIKALGSGQENGAAGDKDKAKPATGGAASKTKDDGKAKDKS